MEIRNLHLRNLIVVFCNSKLKSLLDANEKTVQISQEMVTGKLCFFVHENHSVK